MLTSTDPSGGPGSWTFTNIVPYPGDHPTAANAMFGTSCPTTSLCAVAAKGGQVFTSEDSFAAPPAPAEKKGRKSRKRGRSAPPGGDCGAAMPAVELDGRKFPPAFASSPTTTFRSVDSPAGSTPAAEALAARQRHTASAAAATSSASGRSAGAG